MKTNKKQSKFFTMMILESFMFTVISVVLIAVLSLTIFYYAFAHKVENFVTPFEDNEETILKGNYDEIDIEKQLGKESYFFVLNKEMKVVYKSDTKKVYPFNSYETGLIPIERYELEIILQEFQDEELGKVKRIEYSIDTGVIELLMIVDRNRKVIYSSDKRFSGRLSKNEYECIKGENQEYKYLKKTYTGEDSREYTIVFFNHIDSRDNVGLRLIIAAGYIISVIVIVLLISTILFLIRVNRKVNKPILLLENGINNFEIGKEDELIKYKGPKEFTEICDKFNEMAKRVNDTDRENQKMIGDISHDLKTPLTVLKTYARAVNDDMVSEEERREYLEAIYDKSNELDQLILMFNDYSKLNRSDYKLQAEEMDFNEFIREFIIEKYNELEFLGYNVEVDIGEEEFSVLIDEFQFKRAMNNIISNTIKYNKPGTTIYFRVKIFEDKISLFIGDDGVGVDDSLRSSIFKAFVRGNAARTDVKSSGLGLSIVKKIIELHDGTIRLLEKDESDISMEYEISICKLNS